MIGRLEKISVELNVKFHFFLEYSGDSFLHTLWTIPSNLGDGVQYAATEAPWL